jgi:Arc/MetJ family transcription regulator
MLVTLDLDDDLIAKAQAATGIADITALLNEALKRLVAREAQKRLIELGGSDPNASAAPRRRPNPF